MEQVFEKRGYLLEEFRLFHLKDTAGTQVEPHYHEFCKLLLLRSGSGGYVVDGKRYALEAGDVVLIGSRTVHYPRFAPGTLYERVIIYIDPAFLRNASGEGADLEQLFQDPTRAVLRPNERERKRIFSVCEEMEQELAGDEFGRVITVRALLLRLLVAVGRCMRQGNGEMPVPAMTKDSRIQSLLQYIDENLTELPNVEGLGERVYLSKYHLMRLFRRETGESIHGYISSRRLLAARDLIAGGLSATEACFRVGWSSYSSFYRAYVKQFGVTPTGGVIVPVLEENFE